MTVIAGLDPIVTRKERVSAERYFTTSVALLALDGSNNIADVAGLLLLI